jgi:hypothetical protein
LIKEIVIFCGETFGFKKIILEEIFKILETDWEEIKI